MIDRASLLSAVRDSPPAELPELIGVFAHAQAVATARLVAPVAPPVPRALLLDAREMAARAGVPETWLRTRARRGEIRSVRCGHYVKFREADVLADLERVGATPQDRESRRGRKPQQERGGATTLLPRSTDAETTEVSPR